LREFLKAGRKKSSMNAVTHGLSSASVVLRKESLEDYQEMLDAYTEQFQPANQAEFHLIEEMAAAKWRQRRLWDIEAHFLELEIVKQTEKLDQKYTSYGSITPLSLAYSTLASSGPLPFLTRNESRLEPARTPTPPQSRSTRHATKSPGSTASTGPVPGSPTTHHPQPTTREASGRAKCAGTNPIQNPHAPRSNARTPAVPGFSTTHNPQPTAREANGRAR
jgi:hypothetical protein